MHEFAIAQSLVDAASTEARQAGACRVTALTCRIGALRQVHSDLLVDAFEMAAEGSLCRGARLTVESTFMQATCPVCGDRYPVRDWEWTSPCCGAEGGEISGGDELELVSIEAEVEDDPASPTSGKSAGAES